MNVMSPGSQTILRDFQKLRTADWRRDFFGSSKHQFRITQPLSEATVREFEKKHAIQLPQDYRCFLLEVGNGGAGPYYGLFRLGETDSGWGHSSWAEGDGFVGDLSKPFPHTEAWNDLTGKPHDENENEEIYEQQVTAFEERYFTSANVNGAIPICHIGCALRQWLIVTGPEAGNVWCDDRADWKGLFPLIGKTGGRVTFYRWYRDWLDEALRYNAL